MAILAAPQRHKDERQEDDLSKAVKIMQLLGGGLGLKESFDKQKQIDQQMAHQQAQMDIAKAQEARSAQAGNDANVGILNQKEKLDRGSSYDWVTPETKGATAFRFRTGPGEKDVETVYGVSKRPEKDPLIMAIREQQFSEGKRKADEDAKKKAYDKTTEGRLEKLGTEGKARLDNSKMALSAVQGMSQALMSGDNTFSIWGDNDFTQQRALFEEAIGRMQSGGAIGVEEAKKFKSLAPQFQDSPAMREKKLLQLQDEFIGRMGTLGFKPEEFSMKKAEVSLVPKQKVPTLADGQSGVQDQEAFKELARRKGINAAMGK